MTSHNIPQCQRILQDCPCPLLFFHFEYKIVFANRCKFGMKNNKRPGIHSNEKQIHYYFKVIHCNRGTFSTKYLLWGQQVYSVMIFTFLLWYSHFSVYSQSYSFWKKPHINLSCFFLRRKCLIDAKCLQVHVLFHFFVFTYP